MRLFPVRAINCEKDLVKWCREIHQHRINNMTKTENPSGKGSRKLQIVLCCIFSILCSILLVVGRTVYRTHSLHSLWDTRSRLAGTLAVLLGVAAAAAVISVLAFFVLEKLTGLFGGSTAQVTRSPGQKLFPIFWILSFVSWIPAFLAYYPGIMSYDTYSQSRQVLEGLSGINKYHPPLHTLFWALCIKAGAVLHIDATLIYEPVQMAMLSFAFAVMLSYMVRRRCHPFVILCSALFVMLNPVIAIFSLEMVKDSWVAVFIILVTVRLAELSDAVWEKKCEGLFDGAGRQGLYGKSSHSSSESGLSVSFWVSLTFLTTVLCLLRNNIVYAVILSLPFMLILARGYRVRVLASFLAALIAFGAINGPFYHALGIQEGNSREMLSVPIQQITTVVVNHGFETDPERSDPLTSQDYEAIEHFLPCDKLPDAYNPRFADYAKNSFDSQYFDTNKGEFVKLWLDLFKRYPEDYWSAFLDLNIQLWYPGSTPIDPYSEREYIETGIYKSDYCSGVRTERFPRLLSFYENVAGYSSWMDLPVLSALFAFWTPVWFFVIAFFVLAARGRLEKAVILFIPFFLWFTYLAGPVSCTRYVFPMMVLYPLIVCVLLMN